MKFRICLQLIGYTVVAFITANYSYAQSNSNNNHFNVDAIKGCAPLTVTILSNEASCPCNATCPCDVFLDGINQPGNFTQNQLSINYTTAGIYQLIVQLQNFAKDTIQIEVVENIAPSFELTTCTANQVNVDIQDLNFDTYEINYGDGTIISVTNNQNVPTYTYASSGTKSINIRGINTNAADNCITSNAQNVAILPSLQDGALSNLSLQSEKAVQIDYSGQSNTIYHLQLATNIDNNFQRYNNDNIDPSQNSYAIDDSNLNFENNYYCFRLATFDKCSNSYTGFSNTICSVDLNELVVGNNTFRLNWSTSNNSNSFSISKDATTYYAATTSLSYIDSDQINCNTDYCYTVIADVLGDGSVLSTSLTKCATAISNEIPTSINDINVSVTDPAIEVSWELPVDYIPTEYYFNKNDIVIDTLSVNSYSDDGEVQSCYKISYTDACLNKSNESQEVCSLFLQYSINNGTVTLNWNNYNGWVLGVSEYEVIVESSNGNSTYSAGKNTTFELPIEAGATQQITVQVAAIPANNMFTRVNSNRIEIENNANIIFPNAFVPDGVNNTFNVKGRYIQSVDIKIFTRWGQLIGQVKDKELGWDGTINGQKAPEGTYIFTAEIVDESGTQHARSGAFLLLRK